MDLPRNEFHSLKPWLLIWGGRGGRIRSHTILISTSKNTSQISDNGLPLTKFHPSIKHFTLAASTEEGRRRGGVGCGVKSRPRHPMNSLTIIFDNLAQTPPDQTYLTSKIPFIQICLLLLLQRNQVPQNIPVDKISILSIPVEQICTHTHTHPCHNAPHTENFHSNWTQAKKKTIEPIAANK